MPGLGFYNIEIREADDGNVLIEASRPQNFIGEKSYTIRLDELKWRKIKLKFERDGRINFELMLKCLRVQKNRLVLLNPRVLRFKKINH